MRPGLPIGTSMNRKRRTGPFRPDVVVLFIVTVIGLEIFSHLVSRPLAWGLGIVVLALIGVVFWRRS